MRRMRKFRQSLLVLLTGFVALSCKDDDLVPGAPSLEFSAPQLVNGVFRGVIGATDQRGKLQIEMEGSVPGGIKSLQVVRDYVNEQGPQSVTEIAYIGMTGETNFAESFTYPVSASDLNAATVLKVVIVDNQNRKLEQELAKVEAYWPLDFSDAVSLVADKQVAVGSDFHFLLVTNFPGTVGISARGSSASGVSSNGSFDKVHLVFEYDNLVVKDGVPMGPYLCSPNRMQTLNPLLVQNFPVRNMTIIKLIHYSEVTEQEKNQLGEISKNDVAFLINMFNKYQPDATTERIVFGDVTEQEAFLMFKTADGKIGVIKDYEVSDGSDVELTFDLWMMR
jgi:stage V sporulation protein SpoVS